MIKNKKSQITVLIIIGVILLFSTALVLYIKGQVVIPDEEVRVAIEKVPNEIQPVQRFVSDCLEQVSKEAFELVGAHGGYISVEDMQYSGFEFEKNDANPTEADVVQFPPYSDNHVVYWEYMKKPNECTTCYLGSWRPPLYRNEGGNSIEAQVDKYVQNNLRSCLRNFKEFRDEGYKIDEQGDLVVTTDIRASDVMVSLTYPLKVSVAGESVRISKFQAILPVKFKQVYDMAFHIVNNSAESRFLGLNTLNLISGFSRIDNNALPPFNDLTFTFDTVEWDKKKVKQNIKQVLEVYTQVIQVEGTSNYGSPEFFSDPLMKGLYGGMVLPGQGITNLEVDFLYLGWPFYLEFLGSSSDTLGPTRLEMPLLNLIPLNQYRFVYGLSYPVVVRVEDPSAYGGKGYRFAFAMESNIRNNHAVSNEFVTIPAISDDIARESEFCNKAHRNSGIITIETKDAETGRPLENVNVVFRASQSCGMGQTVYDDNPLSKNFGKSIIEDNFPVGIGTLLVSSPGYVSESMAFATAVDKEQQMEISLDPVTFLEPKVMKRKINDNPFFVGAPENVTENEIILINFEKIVGPGEEPLVSMAAVGPGINTSEQLIQLAPGKFKVSIVYIYNKTIVIPEDEICEGGFVGIGEECEEVPEIVFESFIFPAIEFEQEISSEHLIGAKNIKIFALYTDFPEEHEDMKRIKQRYDRINGQTATDLNYQIYRPTIT